MPPTEPTPATPQPAPISPPTPAPTPQPTHTPVVNPQPAPLQAPTPIPSSPTDRPPGILHLIRLGIQALRFNFFAVFIVAICPVIIGAASALSPLVLKSGSFTAQAGASQASSLLLSLIGGFIFLLLFGALIFIVLCGLRSKKTSIGEALSVGFRSLIRFFIISVLILIAVSILYWPIIFALILPILLLKGTSSGIAIIFIILILITLLPSRLIYSYGLVVDDQSIGAWSAVKSSWRMTQGFTLRTAAIIAVLLTISITVSYFLLSAIFLTTRGEANRILLIVLGLYVILEPIYILGVSVLVALYDYLVKSTQTIVIEDTSGLPTPPTATQA